MKISRETFVARVRAVLGDLPQGGPWPMFVWLCEFERLLARPPVERRAPTPIPTLGCSNSAEVARANGWGPGTVLVGNEGYGLDAIRVDYVGREKLVATHLAKQRDEYGRAVRQWHPAGGRESTWTLSCRAWREPTAEERAALDACGGVG